MIRCVSFDSILMPPRLVPTGIFHLPPWALLPGPFPRMFASFGSGPCAYAPPSEASYPVPSPPGLWKYIFCPRRASSIMGCNTTVLHRPFSCSNSSLWFFALRAFPQWHCLLSHAFTGLDTSGPLHLRPQEGLDCTLGLSHPRGYATSGTAPRGAPLGSAPHAYSKTELFNPWGFTTQVFLRDASFLGPGLQRLLLQRLCPTGHLSRGMDTSLDTPCASTILVSTVWTESIVAPQWHRITLVQEWPGFIVGTHCCATMILDHIN
jgi:hypothetical protein